LTNNHKLYNTAMDHVFIISATDVINRFLDLLAIIWGWLVTGGILKLLIELCKFLLFYYAKRTLDRGEPQKLVIHIKHFLHDHPGFLPSGCEEGLCKLVTRETN
jgi:hypothetical protein